MLYPTANKATTAAVTPDSACTGIAFARSVAPNLHSIDENVTIDENAIMSIALFNKFSAKQKSANCNRSASKFKAQAAVSHDQAAASRDLAAASRDRAAASRTDAANHKKNEGEDIADMADTQVEYAKLIVDSPMPQRRAMVPIFHQMSREIQEQANAEEDQVFEEAAEQDTNDEQDVNTHDQDPSLGPSPQFQTPNGKEDLKRDLLSQFMD